MLRHHDIVFKIWVDDVRPAPDDTYDACAESVFDAIAFIAANLNKLVRDRDAMLLDLDHDAGSEAKWGGDFIKILEYIEHISNQVIVEPAERDEPMFLVRLHSNNPVGVANMRRIIKACPLLEEIL